MSLFNFNGNEATGEPAISMQPNCTQNNFTGYGFPAQECMQGNPYTNGNVSMTTSSFSSSDVAMLNAVSQIAANSNQVTMDAIKQVQLAESEKHMLRMSMEKMKKERQGKPDEYTINDGNIGLCITPKGVQISVGRIQITKVIGFKIINNDNFENVLLVSYIDSKNSERKTIVTETNLVSKSLVGCFPGFEYICSNVKTANGFLAWYINTLFNGEYSKVIPYCAGFSIYTENDIEKANFFCNDNSMPPELLRLCSENIRKNVLSKSSKTVKELTDYADRYLNTPERCLLFAISLCGAFSSVLEEIGCSVKQIFTISSPNSDATKQACIYLKTFNRGQTPISFDSNKTKIRKTLHNTKDEVAVINDCSIVNNDKRRINMLQYVLELNNDNETHPHCTAIISDFAPYLIEDNQKIHIRLSNDFCTEMTQEEENEMCNALNCITYYFITLMCQNYKDTKEYLKNIFTVTFNDAGDKIQNIQSMTSYAAICTMISVVASHLNYNFIFDNTAIVISEIFESKNNTVDSCDDVIANEFASCLSDTVHSGEISVLLHSKDMNFSKGKPQVIIKDDLLMIEECTIRDKVLTKMTTADNVQDIVKALDNVGLLHATKKSRYPLTVYENGNSVRITFIAMEIENVLDTGIIMRIRESKYKEWFSAEAANDNLFPVITNRLGEKAYQRFEFDKSDNMHCFYLGQSGSGKTNSLTERMCSLFKAGQKVVILDTSDSFTKDAIINNLSVGGDDEAYNKAVKFVEDNITFHKVEEHGVPVDILNLKYPALPETKRRIIDSIISAHIPKMGKVQKAALRNGISDLMVKDRLNMVDMYDRLTDSTVSDSLAMQFEDMLSCFLEYEVSEKSWDEFLKESKGIVVISTDAISGSGGSGLVDMLLMSLFYNQRNNPSQHIAVFIDEIQNQNFSPDGAITQILKEGRKYHISLNYATQFLPSRNKDMMKVMSLASLQVFLQPDDISAKAISKTINIPANDLTAMNQGECYISGTLFNHETGSVKKGTVHGFTYRNFVPFEVKI